MTLENQNVNLLALPTIDRFLYSIGLSQYADCFRQNNVEMEQLLTMSENDFEQIGITSFGHKKQLFNSTQKFIAAAQEEILEKQRVESREFIIKFLSGYATLAVIVAIILQFTVKDKMITGIAFFDGLLIAAGLCAFMSPTVIAWWRGHKNKEAILLGNIFLGGTGLGWIVCLVFSLSKINPATAAVLAFLSTRHKK